MTAGPNWIMLLGAAVVILAAVALILFRKGDK
jgi:LPXTG-motif cell wall-anchored protein